MAEEKKGVIIYRKLGEKELRFRYLSKNYQRNPELDIKIYKKSYQQTRMVSSLSFGTY